MPSTTTRVRLLALAAIAAVTFPVSVAAHADLDVPTPADGATVEGTPVEILGTFTQRINPAGSSLVLRDAANAVVARGGVDPDDDRRMVITDTPQLAPGDYVVQWTTTSAEDDELDRDSWTFTVTAAATPAPTPTPEPSAGPSASASATPEPSRQVTPTPSGPATPQDPAASNADVLLPIIAGLAIVLIAAGFLLARRGRPSGPA